MPTCWQTIRQRFNRSLHTKIYSVHACTIAIVSAGCRYYFIDTENELGNLMSEPIVQSMGYEVRDITFSKHNSNVFLCLLCVFLLHLKRSKKKKRVNNKINMNFLFLFRSRTVHYTVKYTHTLFFAWILNHSIHLKHILTVFVCS